MSFLTIYGIITFCISKVNCLHYNYYMAKKYYAVKAGFVPGIYTDWESCKAQVNAFPGAQYKGFATLEEAQEYLGISASEEPSSFPVVPEHSAIAYVDGSFRESSGKFSYGIVFFFNGEDGQVQELDFGKAFSNPELLEMRNVSGEIMGAAQAMKIAGKLGIRELVIYHDYEGISKWCTGEWKAKQTWTQKYRDFYLEMSRILAISFVKVKGHSHDKYNDLADALARKAVGN